MEEKETITVKGICIELYRYHADNFVRQVITFISEVAGIKVRYDLPMQMFNDREAFDKYIYRKIESDIGKELFERALKKG